MDTLDKYLTMLEAEAGLGGFEQLNSYEQAEANEISNYLVRSRALPRPQAIATAGKIVKIPALYSMVKNEMSANGGQGLAGLKGNAFTPEAAALFTINIERLTSNINLDLPFAIFGALEAQGGYRRVLDVPAGITLQSVRYGENADLPNSLDFTYTDGVDTDIVRVSCEETQYPVFLQSCLTDIFRISRMRQGISDVSQLQQFNRKLEFTVKSMFGLRNAQSVVPRQYKTPMQQQQDIIDLDGIFDIDKETAIVSKIIPQSNFVVSLSMFVEKFYRQNSKTF